MSDLGFYAHFAVHCEVLGNGNGDGTGTTMSETRKLTKPAAYGGVDVSPPW